jgi:hypothetical protein
MIMSEERSPATGLRPFFNPANQATSDHRGG